MFQNFGHGVFGLDRRHLAAARLEFDFAFGQGFFADADAHRETDQFGVLEFDAGTFVAVVQNDLDARARSVRRKFFRPACMTALSGATVKGVRHTV